MRCDTHVHVFEPARFPYGLERAYTPGVATVEDLEAHLSRVECPRVVLVQPSVYGTDNRCMLSAIERLGQHRARGVAVVDLDCVSDGELLELQIGGVRGIRLNIITTSTGLDLAKQQLFVAERIAKRMQWHVQLHAKMATHRALLDDYKRLTQNGVNVVLDHFADASLATPASHEVFDELQDAMRSHSIAVKVSAAYRLANPLEAATLAARFYEAAPSQIVWGSDWPHTGGAGGQGRNPSSVEPFRNIDNPAALKVVSDALAEVASDATGFEQILNDNAARIYGFDT